MPSACSVRLIVPECGDVKLKRRDEMVRTQHQWKHAAAEPMHMERLGGSELGDSW